MYEQERQRKELAKSGKGPDSYLRQLRVELFFSSDVSRNLARLSQLTQKTNQFNLTTKRFTEDGIKQYIRRSGAVYFGEVLDKFGPYGIVTMAMVSFDQRNAATIDNFLMSCRVMGRGVENAFMNRIVLELAGKGVKKIQASYVSTKKNDPAKDFLPTFGFKNSMGRRKVVGQVFSLDLSSWRIPARIKKCLNIKVTEKHYG
jgi:FkbH-like protein